MPNKRRSHRKPSARGRIWKVYVRGIGYVGTFAGPGKKKQVTRQVRKGTRVALR
jgi:hypothetical protein